MKTLDDLRDERQQLEADIQTARTSIDTLLSNEEDHDFYEMQIDRALAHLEKGIRQARERIADIDREFDPGPCFQHRCPYCQRPCWLDQDVQPQDGTLAHLECWLEVHVPETGEN